MHRLEKKKYLSLIYTMCIDALNDPRSYTHVSLDVV